MHLSKHNRSLLCSEACRADDHVNVAEDLHLSSAALNQSISGEKISMAGKRFTFSLENVLKVRKHETERARQALLEAAVEREQHEALLADAHQRLQSLAESPTTGGTIGTLVFRQYDAFRRDAQRACRAAQQNLKQKQNIEDAARSYLVDRRRAEEALQNLRDEQKAEHQRLEEAHDIAFMDEQAITGFTRKKS